VQGPARRVSSENRRGSLDRKRSDRFCHLM
jgi:hypothetical protein